MPGPRYADGETVTLRTIEEEDIDFCQRMVNDRWGTAEIGYMIAPDEWGNGYATDALRTLTAHAFRERRIHKLSAQVYETNDASQRVLEKAGYSQEGIFREEAFVDGEYVDVHRYGLLAEEFDG